MAAKHGTRRRYVEGCRCDDCSEAQRIYQRDYRERRAGGQSSRHAAVVTLRQPDTPDTPETCGPGPVESAVKAEISRLSQAEARPGLAQAALALARIMDNPKAVNQQPAAAAKLADILDKLRAAAAQGRRGNLALVRTMTKKGGAYG